jgi:hypothetical protein
MPRFGLLLMQRAGQAISPTPDETGPAVRRMTMSWCVVKTMDYEEDSDESEVEPPHPWLSFVGRTRFGLNPVTETLERQTARDIYPMVMRMA